MSISKSRQQQLLWEFRVYYFYELQLCSIPLLKKGKKIKLDKIKPELVLA